MPDLIRHLPLRSHVPYKGRSRLTQRGLEYRLNALQGTPKGEFNGLELLDSLPRDDRVFSKRVSVTAC